MRSNGFAIYRGPERKAAAEGGVARVERYCDEVVAASGLEFEARADRVDLGETFVVAYALRGESAGFPLVHGYLEGRAGEFAMLGVEDGALFASRDVLGTRPLYADGRVSCIASDHRFFSEETRLLPNGARLKVGSNSMAASGLRVGGAPAGLDECAAEVARLLEQAVRTRARGKRKVAVSFSGGLDSSLVALLAARETEVVLCSAYASGSRDEEHARSAADSLGLELVAVEMTRESVAREVGTLDLPFEPTHMDRALWSIYSTTAREAANHGAELIMLGQLADELFGGYMKYALEARENEEAAGAMMLADVAGSGERAFVRDEEACARFIEARFPFADEELASFALSVPVKHKIAGGERKVVLRRAAGMLGLPGDLAAAPKKAAQYSSGVAKLVP